MSRKKSDRVAKYPLPLHLVAMHAYRWLTFAIVVLGFGVSLPLFAQDFGGMPDKLSWEKLDGDSVSLISTRPGLSFARRVLALDEAFIRLRPIALGTRIEDIDIVVQPVTTVPNGFVSLEPFRSYLYGMPAQNQRLISTNDWVDALAIHEYRHVEQYNSLNRGWTRIIGTIFGEGGRSVMNSLGTPNWFFEGDAVYAETSLTYAGRGRTPDFTALQRALALDSIQYKYIKSRNGSLRSRVPDHYPLGLALVTHGRHVYGDPWPEVVKRTGTFWPPIMPFSLSLKQATGHHTPSFYRETFDSLANSWNAHVSDLNLTEHEYVLNETLQAASSQQLTTYFTPIPLENKGELLVGRKSQTKISELVKLSSLDANEEQELVPVAKLGITIEEDFHAAGGGIVWTQFRVNPKRPNETYSVLMHCNLSEGKTRQLTTKTQLFSPGISADGKFVVAVEANTEVIGEVSRIVFFSATTGERLATIHTKFPFLAYPRFTPDGGHIVVLVKQSGKVSYMKYEVPVLAQSEDAFMVDQTPMQLIPFTRHTLGIPFLFQHQVYYSASYTGIDNIFCAPTDGGALNGGSDILQLTSSRVSATAPSTDGSYLYFIEVEATGDPLVKLERSSWAMRPIIVKEPVDLPMFAPYEVSGSGQAFRSLFYDREVANEELPTQELLTHIEGDAGSAYEGLFRGFRFYTIQPTVNNTFASVGLNGGNILNDFRSNITAGYNINEERTFGSATATLARTWPWVGMSLGQSQRAVLSIGIVDSSVQVLSSTFDQLSAGLNFEAPIRQAKGTYSLAFTPSLGVDYIEFSNFGEQMDFGFSSLVSMNVGIDFRYLRQQAAKHILPRGGILFNASFSESVTNTTAGQFTVSAGVLAPGILSSHTVFLRANARREDATNVYQFRDFHRYARGIGRMLNTSTVGVSADYHFPLWYPDIGVTGLIFIKRLRATFWGDYNRLMLPSFILNPTDEAITAGVDLTLDASYLNLIDIPVGIRFPYIVQTPRRGGFSTGFTAPELLISLDFN